MHHQNLHFLLLLKTYEPGNILDTLDACVKDGIRVSSVVFEAVKMKTSAMNQGYVL